MKKVVTFKLTGLALLVGFCLIGGHTNASDKKEPHTVLDPIQLAVANEMSAFKERDSSKAYELASPEMQKKFTSALKFSTMMRITYWEIYDHVSFKFLGRSSADKHQIQKVEVTGSDGEPYIVLYKLIKDSKGKWLIDDLILLDHDAQPV